MPLPQHLQSQSHTYCHSRQTRIQRGPNLQLQADCDSAVPLTVRSNALAALIRPTTGRTPPSALPVRSAATKRRPSITAADDSFSRQREQQLFSVAHPEAADQMPDCLQASAPVSLPLSRLGANRGVVGKTESST